MEKKVKNISDPHVYKNKYYTHQTTDEWHRSDIKHNRNKPVAEHFNKPDYTLENLRLVD